MSHIADVAAGILWTLPQDRNRASRGMSQPGQRPQQRSLPRSVIPENHMKLPAIKLRIDAAQCGKTAELLDQVADGDDRSGVVHGRREVCRILIPAMSVPERRILRISF